MQRNLRFVLLLLIIAAPVAVREIAAQPGSRYTVLPQLKGKHLPLCSRPGPKVEGAWDPTVQEILDLESHLPDISKLNASGAIRGAQISHPEESLRQYLGIVVNGRNLIYVNAIPKDLPPKGWRKDFVTVCDGGAAVWGVLYNPQTQTFSDLETNGLA
jgi:hypothetical protein